MRPAARPDLSHPGLSAYDAFISLDAIGRTLLRLLVTHQRLLEWQTSSDSERTTRAGLTGFYATMWIAPAVALAAGFFLATMQPAPTVPGPADPWGVVRRSVDRLVDQPAHGLRGSGFDGRAMDLSETHRPPDVVFFSKTFCHRAGELAAAGTIFQEIPAPTIASRTSPTNMGLALLANLAARDFGYLSTAA